MTFDSLNMIRFVLPQVKSTPITGFPGDPSIVPFWDVVSRGKKVSESAEVQPVTPGPTDIGIIMYTSGSTGMLSWSLPRDLIRPNFELI